MIIVENEKSVNNFWTIHEFKMVQLNLKLELSQLMLSFSSLDQTRLTHIPPVVND